jgi:hypothetical protein
MAVKGASIREIRKKVTTTYELISTSYHEAGHAIFALLHCMKVTSVCVFEDKKTKRIHGCTNNTLPLLSSIEDKELFYKLLENEICFGYAGLRAEKHHFKLISGSEKVPTFITNQSAFDLSLVSKLIIRYNLAAPGPPRSAYKQKMNRKALRALRPHWEDISLLAHRLFKHKRLSYSDLHQLLTTKSENKKYWRERFKLIDRVYDHGPLNEPLLKLTLCPKST